MTTSIADLERWLRAPREDEHLEFKAAKNSFDQEKALEYFVALAVDDRGDPEKSDRHELRQS
jgi:ATP-dependent DNA helicase RecG